MSTTSQQVEALAVTSCPTSTPVRTRFAKLSRYFSDPIACDLQDVKFPEPSHWLHMQVCGIVLLGKLCITSYKYIILNRIFPASTTSKAISLLRVQNPWQIQQKWSLQHASVLAWILNNFSVIFNLFSNEIYFKKQAHITNCFFVLQKKVVIQFLSHTHRQPVPLRYHTQWTPLEEVRVSKGLRTDKR